jgi:hypothetical protein
VAEALDAVKAVRSCCEAQCRTSDDDVLRLAGSHSVALFTQPVEASCPRRCECSLSWLATKWNREAFATSSFSSS